VGAATEGVCSERFGEMPLGVRYELVLADFQEAVRLGLAEILSF